MCPDTGRGEHDPHRPAPADTDHTQPGTASRRSVSNALSGSVAGPSVQAGAIHGGVHIHQPLQHRAPVVQRQLVAAPARFTNRRAEVAALDAVLESAARSATPRVVVITGAGGMGKSALTAHWCARIADRFDGGQLYADLGGGPDSSDVGSDATEPAAAPERVLAGSCAGWARHRNGCPPSWASRRRCCGR